MILLLHLVQGPESEDAQETRKAIDIAFALCGSNGGIVAGGTAPDNIMKRPLTEGDKEAWDYFKRLRAKAWQKAGLDPDVVWTREQAVQYCNGQSEPQLVAQEQGPMWNEVPLDELEDLTALAGGTSVTDGGTQTGMEGITSPPNIDWSYLESVWGSGHNPIDLDYDIGDDEHDANA